MLLWAILCHWRRSSPTSCGPPGQLPAASRGAAGLATGGSPVAPERQVLGQAAAARQQRISGAQNDTGCACMRCQGRAGSSPEDEAGDHRMQQRAACVKGAGDHAPRAVVPLGVGPVEVQRCAPMSCASGPDAGASGAGQVPVQGAALGGRSWPQKRCRRKSRMVSGLYDLWLCSEVMVWPLQAGASGVQPPMRPCACREEGLRARSRCPAAPAGACWGPRRPRWRSAPQPWVRTDGLRCQQLLPDALTAAQPLSLPCSPPQNCRRR